MILKELFIVAAVFLVNSNVSLEQVRWESISELNERVSEPIFPPSPPPEHIRPPPPPPEHIRPPPPPPEHIRPPPPPPEHIRPPPPEHIRLPPPPPEHIENPLDFLEFDIITEPMFQQPPVNIRPHAFPPQDAEVYEQPLHEYEGNLEYIPEFKEISSEPVLQPPPVYVRPPAFRSKVAGGYRMRPKPITIQEYFSELNKRFPFVPPPDVPPPPPQVEEVYRVPRTTGTEAHEFYVKWGENNFDKIANIDFREELSKYEDYQQSILDMIIISVNYNNLYNDVKNETFIIEIVRKVHSNENLNIQISINYFINLMFDLEDSLLTSFKIPETFKYNVDYPAIVNVGKKFLKIFDYDIGVNKFPLVFYDVLFPYIRREILPLINKEKIEDRTSRILSLEENYSQLFENLRRIDSEINVEQMNLKNFLNTLNERMNSYRVDTLLNREIKIVYLGVLDEFIQIMKIESSEQLLKYPVRTFASLFKALLPKSNQLSDNSNVEATLKKMKRTTQELKKLEEKKKCLIHGGTIYEFYKATLDKSMNFITGVFNYLLVPEEE